MTVFIDKMYGPYSNKWVPAPRYLLRRSRILGLFNDLPAGKLLEFGCGSGALLSELSRLGFQCSAIEESTPAISIAVAFNPVSNFYKKITDNREENFDYITAFEVLEHIEDDLNALANWKNLLCSQGKLLLSVPAHPHKWNATDEWAGHVRRYSKKGLIAVLHQAGYKILHIESYGFPLANIIEPIRAKYHQKELFKRNKKNTNVTRTNNYQSGIDRNLESKLFFLLKNPIGKLIMFFFIKLQAIFSNSELGNGFIILAEPKQKTNE